MTFETRIERSLIAVIDRCKDPSAPKKLSAAIEYAVFPGGSRMRPRLCLSVAQACGDGNPSVAEAAAAAVELMHCASLVHDDLPCFDDAATRRGKPSVHSAFGEQIAVLAGDAILVLAYEALLDGAAEYPELLVKLSRILSRSVGVPGGIIAGQAWEYEATLNLAVYHRAKTAALFNAAVQSGVVAAGSDPIQWRDFATRLGEAYQVADDLRDCLSTPEELGKPTGQDSLHERPNAVSELGVDASVKRLGCLIEDALASIPSCPGQDELKALINAETDRFTPRRRSTYAA
ncbi:MAG: polyprenyl synthetase family protein [Filomicrobium sp.]